MTAHLRLEGVSKLFQANGDALAALRDVDLEVYPGEFVSVLGPSGCGKSTLLKVIGGLLAPTSGSVLIEGKSPMEAQESKDIGYVFQSPSLLPWRSVIDNVLVPLQVNRRRNGGDQRKAENLVELVGLGQFRDYHPFQLSGGMQHRVALARALVFDPSLLLMDEPLASLDEITRSEMRYELLKIWGVDRKTVVFVTHSISEAVTMSDRVVVLSGRPGQIRGIVDIDLPRPRADFMERSQQFLQYTDSLYQMLGKG